VIDPAHPDFCSTPISSDRPGFGYASDTSRPLSTSSLSVVTCFTRDRNAFVETARSLQGQSFQDWEWLIVTESLSREAAETLVDESDLRVKSRLFETPQAALNAARGAFVLHLPPGDLLEPTAAEKWLWFLTSHSTVDCVDSFHVSVRNQMLVERAHGQLDPPRSFDNWAGVLRREAFRRMRRRCATLPEYLHWIPAARDGAASQYAGEERKRGRRRKKPRIELDSKPFQNPLGKSRSRLLVVLPFVTTGGADKFSVDLVSQLSRRGWEATVVTTLESENPWLPRIARYTPDIFALPNVLQPHDYPRFLSYLIGSRQPDAMLISNSLFAYNGLPYLRRVARRVAIVDYSHSAVEGWLGGGYPRLSVDRQACLDLQITSSTALKEWMVERGGDRGRIEVCYIGTSPRREDARPSRAELGLPEGGPIILYPCRLTHEKQPAVFVRTLEELSRRGHAFQALVVGDGPYLSWLEAFVEKHRLDSRIRFLGYQPNDRMRDLMSVADCVFLPSKYEGISAVCYEAMAEGVSVVGADVGGQRELVTPECGVLIQPGDEDDQVDRYTEALARLIDDPAARRAMGDAARARIEREFTVERMGDRMEALLERAIELAAATPRALPTQGVACDAAHAAVLTASWHSSAGLSVGPISWRARHLLYRALSALGMPLYRLGLRLGFGWLEQLKDRVFHALFPRS
jgi:glycosyltransferase involved in cell wall biosynthesis